MAEYIDKKEAIKVLTQIGVTVAASKMRTVAKCISAVESMAAVPVVRCRECKHYKPEEYFSPCVLPQGLECAKPDDFCSYGQRKEAAHG